MIALSGSAALWRVAASRVEASAQSDAATPTFSRDVAPVFYKHCTTCHRPGEVAPMSLLSYDDARPWAKSIREKILEHEMPPWAADPRYGKFREERHLEKTEADTILEWIKGGAPEGNPRDLPEPPKYVDGWALGEPDLVLEPADDFQIPASGAITYQHFRVPTNFTEDHWLQSVEIRPGDRERVHHAVIFYTWPRVRGEGRAVRADQPERLEAAGLGPVLASYGPGIPPKVYPPGTAKRLHPGTTLVFQMHYQANGTPGRDRTRVGLTFAKSAPAHEIHTQAIGADDFVIPAGVPDFVVRAHAKFLKDVRIWSLLPHGHLRLRNIETELSFPTGRSEIALSVPKFNFDHQDEYTFIDPVSVPAGTRLEVTAHYDNSDGNPRNPDPKVDVPWGIQTWEEMMMTIVDYSLETEAGTSRTGENRVR